MIETAMLVAFGFCAATLLAVLFLPLVSRRASRLAVARMQDLVPLSVDEIAAERDGVRATSAVEQRRLEQKAERIAANSADREAELGRRTAELIAAEQARDAERAEKVALAADLDRVRTTLDDTETKRAELERKSAELEQRLRDAEQLGRTLVARRDELEALAEERRGTIASLETRCSGLEMRREDLEHDVERLQAEQTRLQAALEDMTRERDLSRQEIQLVRTHRAMAQDDLADASQHAESFRLKLAAKTDALASVERKLMTAIAERTATEAELAELKRRFELLEARLIEAGGLAAETLVEADLDSLRASVSRVADDAIEVLGGTRSAPTESSRQDTAAEPPADPAPAR